MPLELYRHPDDAGSARLDALAPEVFDLVPTRSSARKAARRGELLVDGVPRHGGWWVQPGQTVELNEPDREPPAVFPLDLEVVHDDPHFAVVVKVAGFPSNGPWHKTIEHALPHNLTPTAEPDALRAPRPVHRLDGPTGGLLACAKTRSALAALGVAFQSRLVTKRYRAIAIGRLDGAGEVSLPVDGREARSRWAAVAHTRSLRSGWLTTVDLWPETGRTHQLRQHLCALGHPVLGDAAYGIEGLVLRGKGLFLWAVELALPHPHTGDAIRVETGEPPKFHQLRVREQRRWDKVCHDARGAPDDAPATEEA